MSRKSSPYVNVEPVALDESRLSVRQRDPQQHLTTSVQDLVSVITQLANDATEDRKLITELQTENRRILERLEHHIETGHDQPNQ